MEDDMTTFGPEPEGIEAMRGVVNGFRIVWRMLLVTVAAVALLLVLFV